MASMDLFEEWRMDDVHNQSKSKAGESHPNDMKFGMEEEDEIAPMFALQRLDWSVERCAPPPPPPSKGGLKRLPKEISKAVFVNRLFVFGTTDGSILRWKMDGGGDCEEIELSKKPDDNIKHLFVDPTGNHVIASLKNGDSYYLHSRSTKPKKMSKLQGTIESVGFDKALVSESNTKSFLVGTSSGRLYEMAYETSGKESSGKERVCQLVHQLDESSTGGITSIYFETFPSSSVGEDVSVLDGLQQQDDTSGVSGHSSLLPGARSRRLFVMCTTSSPTRLYHFLGGGSGSATSSSSSSSCLNLFQDYKASGASTFIELPGSVERSELLFFFKNSKNKDRNQTFALLTKQGMYNGSLLLNNIAASSSSEGVLAECSILPFTHRQFQQRRAPISILMTEFHFLLLYSDSLVVQSKISGEVQQEENLFLLLTSSSEDSGEAVGFAKDTERNLLWLVTTTSLFQITVTQEDRVAWQLHLDRAVRLQDARLFDTAHHFCKTEVIRPFISHHTI